MPALDPSYIHYLEVFRALSETRSTNTTPIPFSEIKAYIDLMKIVDEVEIQDYVIIVRSLDRIHVAYNHKINAEHRAEEQRRAQEQARR